MALRLNLGCGRNLKEGFTNVDVSGKPDVKYDLDKYPYPFKANSVDFILAAHVLEHLDKPLTFLKECQRILKKGGRMEIRVPHVSAFGGSFGTMEHKSFFHERAIDDVTGINQTEFIKNPFKLVKIIVKKGRFLFWQKREIIWILEKI